MKRISTVFKNTQRFFDAWTQVSINDINTILNFDFLCFLCSSLFFHFLSGQG